jgi:hypothetical protein
MTTRGGDRMMHLQVENWSGDWWQPDAQSGASSGWELKWGLMAARCSKWCILRLSFEYEGALLRQPLIHFSFLVLYLILNYESAAKMCGWLKYWHLNRSFVLFAGVTTEIQFLCNTSAVNANPKFIGKSGKTYSFELETPLACNTWPQECMVGSLAAVVCAGVCWCVPVTGLNIKHVTGVGPRWWPHWSVTPQEKQW